MVGGLKIWDIIRILLVYVILGRQFLSYPTLRKVNPSPMVRRFLYLIFPPRGALNICSVIWQCVFWGTLILFFAGLPLINRVFTSEGYRAITFYTVLGELILIAAPMTIYCLIYCRRKLNERIDMTAYFSRNRKK